MSKRPKLRNVEDAYPLSPLQQGMLFHNLYSPSAGEYFMQMVYTMRGALDAAALEGAWQQVVNRHPILRTAFVWEGLEEPLQVVRRQAALEWALEDVRSLPRAEQEAMLEAYLKADRQRGFELSRAPLMRCALIRSAEDEHKLIWSYHHLLLDGWCLALIIKEVSAFYHAICRGEETALPPTRPYRDYIAWLQRRDMAQAESFWRRTLAGYTAPVRLPSEQASEEPGARVDERGRDHTLSASATEALQSLARQHQMTMYNLVQGAWALLLSRYSGEDDVVFGVTVSGRPPEIAGVESMVGLFINTLPTRVKVTPEASLAHWLKALHAQQTELLEYQHSPLMQVQRWSEVAPPQPLFESILVFENYASKETSGQLLGGLEIIDSFSRERTSYPLTVYVSPGPRLSFRIRHDPRRFGDAAVDRLLAHLGSLLESMAAHPDGRLSETSMLTAAEERKVLVEWNDTHAHYDAAKTFVRLFEEQAERTPDALAVVYEQERLSYRTLNQRANLLAHHLRAEGVGPEVLVGICVERSTEMLVGLLGIAKAGGAYVPLDPSYPPSRLAFMLEDAGVRLLLTQERLVETLAQAQHAARVIRLDSDWETIARQNENNPPDGATTSNLAYVIYTSGSTGKPKGVQVSHLALANFLHAMRSRPGLQAHDKLLSVTTLSFDIAALELYLPLTVGACVQIVSQEAAFDAGLLAREISNYGATVMQATPAMWRLLLDSGWEGDGRLKILCGGEALSAELAGRLLQRVGGLWNLYGPTETTVWSTAQHVETAENPVPLGRPIANTETYILDASLRPAAVGVPGALYIGGDGLARGYLRRPALTAEKFIPHPFSLRAGARLYATGDTARYMSDGRVEYFGRSDQQVKVRGFRIELGEVEAAVLEHGGVRECVTAVREDEPGDKRLVAYVVPHRRQPPRPRQDMPYARAAAAEAHDGNGHRETAPTGPADDETTPPLSIRELGHFLRTKLPAYMLPSAFVELDALPLTPNGKVDRRALPSPGSNGSGLENAYVAPQTLLQEMIATIWADVLGTQNVGIRDNFFESGGHSLLATQLVSRLQSAFGVELPLRRIFEMPTVSELAEYVERHKAGPQAGPDSSGPLPAVVPDPANRHEPFHLTDVQQAYWVGRSVAFELGNVATHIYVEFDNEELDVTRLSAAFQTLIERHEMLRAVVLPDGRQQILKEVPPYQIKVLDLRGAEPRHADSTLEAVREQMSHQVLRADQWPLFDLRVTLVGERHTRLHIGFDLLIGDARSFQILTGELQQLYLNPEAALEPLELSFRDYVLAEAELQNSERYRRAQQYWDARLPTLPPAPELPLAKSPAMLDTPTFVRREGGLEPGGWARLKSRAARAGLTPSAVLLAAFSEVLGVWSKSPRFTLNLTLFNRLPLHPQVNSVVGDFTSLTLLEVDNSAVESFERRARRVQGQLWNDLDHRYVSGVRVLRELARAQNTRDAAAMPVVFTSMLNLAARGGGADAPEAGRRDGWVAASAFSRQVFGISQTPQVWLDHQTFEQGGALGFNWDAVEELFPAGMLDEMFDAYLRLLRALAAEEGAWDQATPLQLVPAEQLRRRAEVNATEAPVPEGELLHTMFAARAAERPEALAVVSPERSLTYGELFRLGNRLGRELRRLGARPNRLVAVVMEKGWAQVASVLGVLQSGAAYLPVDAALPKERLWYLLEQGEVEVVLTQTRLDEGLEWPERVRRISVDGDLGGASDEPLAPAQRAEDLAYVIFTSGSTGQPKGVMIDHRGALNTVIDINRRFDVRSQDRVLALSSLSFDLSVYDIFGPLAAGGAVVVPNASARPDPQHWAEVARRERVTIWNSVPALMDIMVEHLRDRGERLPEGLRVVMLSGDWVPVGLPGQIKSLAEGGVEVYSLGGATEASIWSIIYPVGEVDPGWKSIPYGKPMANQSWQVLNEWLEPCPVWTPGQLHIGGVGLAKGYWRDEEKTGRSFITHPRTGERLYRTGDLGRYLPDGNIEFLGREDSQVKVQGYRIELGEIETTLEEYEGVRAAAVLAAGEPRGNKRLAAFVVPAPGAAPGANELQDYLRGRLPDYMVPASFTFLDALPLTPNGKVDRRALAAPELARSGMGREYVAPRTPLEETLAKIFADTLQLERVGIHDNFFELGGHSLLATQVVSRVREALRVEVTLRDMFDKPTVEKLSEVTEQAMVAALQSRLASHARVTRPA